MKSKTSGIGDAIRAARKQNALSQKELATKLGVTQATISNWEVGKAEPDAEQREKLQTILGADALSQKVTGQQDASSVLAAWLSKARQEARMTVAQVAEKANVSVPTLYNIEAGRAQNPRRRTMELLEKALGKKFEQEFQEEVRKASTIEGIGEFQDFDPHDETDWPSEAGIYVFYDISDRPVYVGMSGSISGRIREHNDRFWFKRPIVERASYVPVKDKKLRKQIETILIKFLKSNAIINKQGVEREKEE
jgi:transcriptional regulator with XRE-family HTH domain